MVLAVNLQEAPEKVKAYTAKHHLTFPHVLDADAKVGRSLGVPGTPATFFVDRAGQIVGRAVGYRDWNTPKVHLLVESLLQATP